MLEQGGHGVDKGEVIQQKLSSEKILKQELNDRVGDGTLEGFNKHDPAAVALASYDVVDSGTIGARVMYVAEEVGSSGVEEVSKVLCLLCSRCAR